MSEFISRYGQTDGGNLGCPDDMYPWDVDYPASEAINGFENFKAEAEGAQDVLNLPISWYFNPADEGGEFVLVYVMPRKYGKTFSIHLAAGYDRAEVEEWLEQWTKGVAARHYGWTEPIK